MSEPPRKRLRVEAQASAAEDDFVPARLPYATDDCVIVKDVQTDDVPRGSVVYLEPRSATIAPCGHPQGLLAKVIQLISRPLPTDDDVKDGVVFQLSQIDYVTVPPKEGIPPPRHVAELREPLPQALQDIAPWPPLPVTAPSVPVVRVFGSTANDLSVCMRVYGFEPYFKVRLTEDVSQKLPADLRILRWRLDQMARKALPPITIATPVVVCVERAQLKPLQGVHDATLQFLKITTCLPKHVPVVRRIIEAPGSLYDGAPPLECMEADVPFPIRYMKDVHMTGCCWIRVRYGEWYFESHARGTPLSREKGGYCARRGEAERRLKQNENAVLDDFWEDYGDPYGEIPEIDAFGRCAPPGREDCAKRWETRNALPQTDESRCSIQLEVGPGAAISLGTEGKYAMQAPMRILSFDTEAIGKGRMFPEEGKDPFVCITLEMWRAGETKAWLSVVLQLWECDAVIGNNTHTLWFDDEKTLMMGFRDIVVAGNPEGFTGHNTPNFDWKYLIARAETMRFARRFCDMSWMRSEPMRYKACQGTSFASKATARSVDTVIIPGAFVFDIYVVVVGNNNYKLSKYTLNAMSEAFLGEHKLEVHYTRIPILQRGEPMDRELLARYCLRDTDLVLLIIMKLLELTTAVEMARATGVPLEYLVTRGQSVRISCLLWDICGPMGIAVQSSKPRTVDEMQAKYEGAIVLEPLKGYTDYPVGTLDFSSLYPSIMMSHNLCYSTILSPEQMRTFFKENYEIAPNGFAFLRSPKPFDQGALEKLGLKIGVDFDCDFDPKVANLKTPREVPIQVCAALKLAEGPDYAALPGGETALLNGERRHGVLPRLLSGILRARKIAKTQMEAAKEPAMKSTFNCRQLSLKVTANAVYGNTGASQGRLSMQPIASAVTGYGRDMILLTKKTAEEKYHATVHYGDSVPGDTPIFVKRTGGTTELLRIDELGYAADYSQYRGDKEAFVPDDGVCVWSDGGWTEIRRVIRHRTCKKILKIITETGCVDVTEDHSLLRRDGAGGMIEPRIAMESRTPLLHADLPQMVAAAGRAPSERLAYVWGLFFLRGYCDDKTWEIGFCQPEAAETGMIREIVAAEEMARLAPGSNDRLVPDRPEDRICLIGHYTALFYSHRARTTNKKVPDLILAADVDVRRAFLRGLQTWYYAHIDGEIIFSLSGKTAQASLFFLLDSLGYEVTLSAPDDEEGGESVIHARPPRRGHLRSDVAINCDEIVVDGGAEVYDLETENRHFSAGIGRLVVHNTDSVMVDFGHRLPVGTDIVPYVLQVLSAAVGRIDEEKRGLLECQHRVEEIGRELFSPDRFVRMSDPKALDGRPVRTEFFDHLRQYVEPVVDYVLGGATAPKESDDWLEKTIRKRALESRDEICAAFTESVRFVAEDDITKKTAVLCKQAADYITELLPRPTQLEFEKVLVRWLLENKKRYAYLRWMNGVYDTKITAMGLENKRRDNAPIVKKTVDDSLTTTMKKDDLRGAVQLVLDTMRRIRDDECSLDELTITSGYMRKEADYFGKQKHTEVVKKMKKRDPATAPRIGERVAFVMVAADKKARGFERAEDPVYVLKNKVPIDKNYYIENQLKKPLTRIFSALIPDPKMLFDPHATVDEVLAGHKIALPPAPAGAPPPAKKRRIIAAPSTAPGCLGKWVKRTGQPCLRCNVMVPGKDIAKALCDVCSALPGAVDECKTASDEWLRDAREALSKAMKKCAACGEKAAGTDVEDCGNAECAQFYVRSKAAETVKGAEAERARFEII
jgi:DNA polymerase elongation subunit (family B)